MTPKTSIPLVQVGCPDKLALVAIKGCASRSSNALATLECDCRSASRPVLPVTFKGTREDAGAMMVSGPGQNFRASK
jgi:hypothetical protein